MFKGMFVCLAAVALSACSTLNQAPVRGGTSIAAQEACLAPPGASTYVLDDKALYAAEAFYNVPAKAYYTLNQAEQLSPALKAQVKPVLVKAGNALDLARLAFNAKNAADFSCRINSVYTFAGQARAILPETAK